MAHFEGYSIIQNEIYVLKQIYMEDANLINRLRKFMENEARSCSMEPACVTPEYVYRMWGGSVPLEEIEGALTEIRRKM